MAKQLNVNLAMTADTSKAKAELQVLQKQLDNLMMSANKKDASLGLSSEIQKATQMVAQLKVQLESATSSTGKLDLTKFNESLQKSGANLNSYRTALQSLGPAGTQAFSKLASSIMQAEVPLRRSNALLSNFATTLKNTARWQISSSILHGFMGALSGAYGYAQDLNESLNNIRIVTGQSVDQMAQFAEQANKAARALSTTTTAYTDAALIYYQQGLTGKEVTERTDATIKLANVSRQSAEDVSSQMTAIWNNFYDGSKSIEYYADVITALGAATASSSDEIAQGLQKFAAVADTVGLSYEKATAALATVVAETRQSADVVGTAFKTMFARFQGLSLGETLEDGVDLNKYSKALATIGVNILDANGELKIMDDILDETAERWNQISEAQRVALAETVAGTRQYAQFMAIMNSYDKIQANQGLAEGSEGTLQKQADIYAESWEAAGKRVKAAAQSIYSDLLDDKFFIKLLNNLEKVISFFDKLIDNTGGLKGVLLTLGSVLTTVFGPQIQAQLNNMVASIAAMTPKGQQAAMDLRNQATKELGTMAQQSAASKTSPQQGTGMEAAYSNQAQLQQALLDNAKNLTAEEQQRAQLILDMNNQLGQEAIEAGKIADARERELKALSTKHSHEAERQASQTGPVDQSALQKVKDVQQVIAGSTKSMELLRSVSAQVGNTFQDITKPLKQGDQETKKMVENFKDIAQNGLDRLEKVDFGKFGPDATALEKMDRLREIIAKCGVDFDSLSQKDLDELAVEIQQVSDEFENAADDIEHNIDTNGINNLRDAYNQAGMEAQQAGQASHEFVNGAKAAGSASVDASDKVIQLGNSAKSGSNYIRQMRQEALNFGSVMSTTVGTIMSVASAINMIKNIGKIWSDDDATVGEKILQTFMGLGAILPLITNMSKVQTMVNTALAASNIAVKLSLLEVYLIIAAVVAIGVILVKIFENIKKASPEGKLKAAKEEAKALDDALNNATTAANDLRSAIEKYTEVEERLKSCTKGTQEWRDALKEVNEAAADVINNIHGLSAEELKNSYNTDNGYISFNDGALEMFQKKADMAVSAANYAVTIGENNVAKVQNNVDLARIADEFFAKGALNTEPADNLHWTSLSDKILKNLDILANANIDNFRDKLTEFGINVEDVSDHDLEILRQQVIELANSAELADEKLSLLSKLKIEDITENQYSDAVEKVAADQLEVRTQEIAQDYKDRLTDEGKYRGSNTFRQGQKNSSALQEVLNELNSAQNTKWVQSANAIRGNDKNRTFEFLDASGEKHELTAQQIADTIAASKALEEVTGSAKKAAEALSGVSAEGQSFIANEGFDNLTYDQYQKMTEDYQLAGSGYNYFKNQNVPEELAKQLGEQLDTAFEAGGIDWNGIADKVPEKLKPAFDKAIGGLTESQANSLIAGYEKLSNLSDKTIQSTFDTILSQISDPKVLSDVLARFGEVDFSDWDSIDQFKEDLLDLGIEFNNVDIDDFIKRLGLANDAIKSINVDELAEKFGKIQKIIDKITVGGTISQKDYDELTPAAQSYFKQNADDSYTMVGSVDQLRNDVATERREKISRDISYQTDRMSPTKDKIAEAKISFDYGEIDRLTSILEEQRDTLERLDYQYLSTAQNVGDLNKLYTDILVQTGDNVTASTAYGEVLIKLASQYDSTTQEIEHYQGALATGNEELIEAAREHLAVATSVAEQAEQYGLDADELEDLADIFKEHNDELEKNKGMLISNAEAAADAASRYKRLNNGINDLADNYADYEAVVKRLNKAETAEAKATVTSEKNYKALRKTLADILDTNEELIDANFMSSIDPQLLDDLAEGGDKAKAALKTLTESFIDAQAAEYGLSEVSDQLKEEIDALGEGAIIDLDNSPALQAMLEAWVQAGLTADEIQSRLSGMQIDCDVTPFTGSLAEAVEASAAAGDAIIANASIDAEAKTLTVDSTDVNEDTAFNESVSVRDVPGMFFSAETESGELNKQVTHFPEYHKVITPVTVSEEVTKETTATGIKLSNAHKSAGGKVSNTSGRSGGGGGNKGGGGGSKISKATQKQHTENRYANVQSSLNQLSREYSRASSEKDRLFGTNRLNAIDKETAALNKVIGKTKDYINEIKKYKDIDYNNLMSGIAADESKGIGAYYTTKDAAGNVTGHYADIMSVVEATTIQPLIDTETGLLLNYEELMQALEDYKNKQIEEYNKLDAAGQEAWDNAGKTELYNAQYEAIKDIIEQYKETSELWQDTNDDLAEKLRQLQDLNFEKWQTELDLKVDLNESQLKRLETAARILGDSVYKTVEVMKNLFSADNKIDSQYSTFLNRGKEYEEAYKNAQALYDAGEISQDQFIQAVQTARDGIYEVIDSLLDMNEKMRQFYSETIDGAVEELRKLTDQMAHHVEVMEHLKNLLSLTGKEFDYESMETVLKATVEMERNALEESTAEYKMFQEQADNARKTYQELLNNPAVSEEAAREFKEAVLDPAIAQAREAENKMYEDAEAYLESVVELYKNTLDKIMAAREDALTKGLGWDFLADSMERAKAVQEEYLTKTNQIYETNTLLRKLSQDIDKTDSVAAKTKLKNFSTEIEQMQKQEKLNQSDLDIAKARYELLLAQIALEEAQNAKSIVRLQRDSEGNYGYVYTADQDKINDAEQNFADKQNDLYNLVLGQANDYGEKITQIEREKYEALQQLALDYQEGRITTQAEFDEKYLQTAAYYDDLLEAQRHSYYTALGWLDEVATTDHTEAWTTAYKDVIDAGENYRRDTIDTFTEIKSSMLDLDSARKEVTDNTSLGLNDLKEKTDTLKRANEQLKNELISNTIPTMGNLLTSVSEVTAEWALQYDQIMAMISAYMQLAAAMDMAERNAATQYDFSNVSDFSSEMQKEYANNGFSARFYALGDVRNERGTSGYLSNDELSTLFTTAQQKGIDLSGKYFTRELYNEIVGMASGGYTGEWGSDGKLAILHEKELVLGAEDTANILATIELVRQISSAIDLRAAASSISTGLNSPSFGGLDQTLEQEVTIHAEFPNATDHTEIEEAFNNLINRATQYAARPSNITYKTPRI